MKADFFNEAIVAAMLTAAAGESSAGNEELLAPEQLRERLSLLLDKAGKEAVQAGIPAELAETADFAVCAFIDEALLSAPAWSGRQNWLKKPLQLLRHSTLTAGEDFYKLLNSLLDEAGKKAPLNVLGKEPGAAAPAGVLAEEKDDPLAAVLEIFALLLAQGFTGMYYGNPRAVDEQLDRIGRFVPAVKRQKQLLFSEPASAAASSGLPRPRGRGLAFFQRFDWLDWALWIMPALLTFLLYQICSSRLDQMLQSFLQGVR